jgi:Zn-dependent protease
VSKLELFLWLVPLLVASMVLHELAHAVVATRLGDPTPREHGRLTLNPISHLDPIGTAMFAITYWLSSFMFGWAKPVLVQPRYFRHPKEYMALVAVAGPITNFLIAFVTVAVIVHSASSTSFRSRRSTGRGSWAHSWTTPRTRAGALSTNTGSSSSSGSSSCSAGSSTS